VCAALAVLVLGGCDTGKTAPARQALVSGGVTIELPPGWQPAKSTLTPNLQDPKEVLAAGTYPLRYRPNDCAQVPVSALKDLGPDDAFLELEERARSSDSSSDDFPPRPRHFGPTLGGPSEAADCVPGKRITDHWLNFSDRGRRFYALVAFGPAAPKKTQDEAWRMLDSLKVRPAP
jgi:hypothetical protein